jgi:hypothetical protein
MKTMRNTVARRLRKAIMGRLPMKPSIMQYLAAKAEYRAAKREWSRTPTPARMAATPKEE